METGPQANGAGVVEGERGVNQGEGGEGEEGERRGLVLLVMGAGEGGESREGRRGEGAEGPAVSASVSPGSADVSCEGKGKGRGEVSQDDYLRK